MWVIKEVDWYCERIPTRPIRDCIRLLRAKSITR